MRTVTLASFSGCYNILLMLELNNSREVAEKKAVQNDTVGKRSALVAEQHWPTLRGCLMNKSSKMRVMQRLCSMFSLLFVSILGTDQSSFHKCFSWIQCKTDLEALRCICTFCVVIFVISTHCLKVAFGQSVSEKYINLQ